jgi:hypothetical protein
MIWAPPHEEEGEVEGSLLLCGARPEQKVGLQNSESGSCCRIFPGSEAILRVERISKGISEGRECGHTVVNKLAPSQHIHILLYKLSTNRRK